MAECPNRGGRVRSRRAVNECRAARSCADGRATAAAPDRARGTATAARWPADVPAVRARAPHAEPGLRAADREVAVAEVPLARAAAHRRALLRVSGREVRDRAGRDGDARPVV